MRNHEKENQVARRRGVSNFFSPFGALIVLGPPWEGARAHKRTRCRKALKAGPFEGKNKSERSSGNRTRGRRRDRVGKKRKERERVRVTQMRILSSYAVILSKCSRNCGPPASRDADYSKTAVFTSGFARPVGPRKVIPRWSVFYGVCCERASERAREPPERNDKCFINRYCGTSPLPLRELSHLKRWINTRLSRKNFRTY